MANNDVIDRIIDEVNIAEVIGEYLPILPDGGGFKCVCPFHNDTHPSMKISPAKKIYKCFSCGNGGNVIQFVQRFEKIPFNEALGKLAKRIGIELSINRDPAFEQKKKLYDCLKESTEFFQFYLFNSDEGLVALEYLKARGINEELIKRFKIGLAPEENNYLHLALDDNNYPLIDQVEAGMVRDQNGVINDTFKKRIMFPLTDFNGNTVGFSGRIYKKDDHAPKYLNSSENLVFHKGQILYNFDKAAGEIRKSGDVFIFEGFMDVIAAAKAGVDNAVATMGTALTMQHVKALQQVAKRIILCFDGDAAGIEATYKAAQVLNNANIIPYAVAIPDGMDPDEYQTKHGSDALNNYLHNHINNVYEYMYQNARLDLIINDVVSIQRFKEKVFSFLKYANDTIREFYLKKLSDDTNINLDNLNKEFGNLVSQIVYQQEESLKAEQIKKDLPQIKKVKKIPIKIYRALSIIIYHTLFNKERFIHFFNEYVPKLPMCDFPEQLDIIQAISVQFENGDQIDLDKLPFIEGSSTYKLFYEILNSKMYDSNNVDEYNGSIKTIDNYVKNIKKDEKFNSALSDDDKINDYVEFKKSL